MMIVMVYLNLDVSISCYNEKYMNVNGVKRTGSSQNVSHQLFLDIYSLTRKHVQI